MTTVARRIAMFARYPADYSDELKRGEYITREKKCSKGHTTEQKGISSEWLATKSDGARDLYSKDYELDEKGRSWLPKLCQHPECRGRIR